MASLPGPEVLSLLACPKCRGDLTLAADEKGLICETCHVSYPIREGVPILLIEESVPLRAAQERSEGAAAHSPGEKVVFVVVEGKNKGERIEVERKNCRAIGRSLDDTERTRIFSVETSLSLDDSSKKIVVQYVSKQFNKGGAMSAPGGNEISGFVRGADFQVRDLSVSRLHAMIFHDESGAVGILDLVSKNGTFVNGAEIESRLLKKGDLIAIGGTKLRFE